MVILFFLSWWNKKWTVIIMISPTNAVIACNKQELNLIKTFNLN